MASSFTRNWLLLLGAAAMLGGGQGLTPAHARQPEPDEAWARRDSGPINSSESHRMMAVDASGNVFVTGQVDGSEPKTLMATWKYNSSGTPLWGTTGSPFVYYAPMPVQKVNYGVAVVPDEAGGCWVAGAVTKDGEGLNIVVIHYDSDGGILSPTPILWNNHLQNGDDWSVALAVTSQHTWVGAVSTGAGTGADFFLIGFSNSTGGVVGFDRYDGPSSKTDTLSDMSVYALAAGGSGGSNVGITVAGTSFDDTTKNDAVILHYIYDGTTLARTANSPIRYTAGGGATDEIVTSMTTRFNGNDIDTYACGSSNAPVNSVNLGHNFMVLFNYSRAAQVFAATPYDGIGGDDVAYKIDYSISRTTQPELWIYVTGSAWMGSTNWYDVVTRAYRIDRSVAWTQAITGATDDRVADMICIRDGGDLYLLTKRFNGTDFDFRTLNYNLSEFIPTQIWTNPPIYGAPNGGPDSPASIKFRVPIDPELPDIHVSGRSQGSLENSARYATVKYTQE